MSEVISEIAKSQIDFFSGKNGDEYTERNKDNLENCAACVIYNCAKLSKAKSILEVGVGIGNNLSRLEKIANVYGVDINDKALTEGKKKYPFVNFQKGSIYEIPFPDNNFDLVFTRGIIIHIPPNDRIKALSELVRVSKKYILNIEYHVKDENEFFEDVEWRGEKNRLWRINLPKYWKYFKNITVKEHSLIPEEYDKSNNHICLVKKI